MAEYAGKRQNMRLKSKICGSFIIDFVNASKHHRERDHKNI